MFFIKTIYARWPTVSFEYEYTIKNHLGNENDFNRGTKNRCLLAATMETADAGRDTAVYSNINETRNNLPEGYPTNNCYSDPNEKVAR